MVGVRSRSGAFDARPVLADRLVTRLFSALVFLPFPALSLPHRFPSATTLLPFILTALYSDDAGITLLVADRFACRL